MPRTIMHIDMNAFFASVEQRCNPALRGRPIAVIGSSGRTVVTTCSYEARAFGVKTGMNKYEAKNLCRELIFVVGDNRKYTETSRRIVGIFRRFSPVVEVSSIDEAFLDITGTGLLFGSPETMARSIKKTIRDEIGITCSVGIGPNKLIAKLASGMEKPDGLVIVRQRDIQGLLLDLPVGKLCGIGKSLSASLELMGIKTCSELARAPAGLLRRRFGITGERLSLMGRGVNSSEVVPLGKEAEAKSLGHSMTLAEDISDKLLIEIYILKLSEMVARRARKHGFRGRRVTLTLRYSDFNTFTRQRTINTRTNDASVISATARVILSTLRLLAPVRLIGISIASLTKDDNQLPLFEAERKRRRMLYAMDGINDRFGNFTVMWGSLAEEKKGSEVISPSWRPSGVKCIDVC